MKAGALIVTGEGPCYLHSFDRWPDAVAGKKVSATGRLLRNKWPRTKENDDSAIGGEAGEQWMLDDVRWSSP